jgi:hypothetical protein
MTPKYSAQWWEKVTAKGQPISAEHAPPTSSWIAPVDQPEIPQKKAKAQIALPTNQVIAEALVK